MSISETRTEKDLLGEVKIEKNCLYGIHTQRAMENFPVLEKFNRDWYMSCGLVKLACHQTIQEWEEKLKNRYHSWPFPFASTDEKKQKVILAACEEVSLGLHYEWMQVPALSGGAGTSQNMNINEIIANRALILLDKKPGQYEFIDPLDDVNRFQSTNDVIPTALKVAIHKKLNRLEEEIRNTLQSLENLEKKYKSVPRNAYTQMQKAMPSTWGHLLGAWAQAFSRDWWRISKGKERIKEINLGGGAIGTGAAIPRYYIMEAAKTLRTLSSLPLCRSENLADCTQNLDTLCEMHSLLKDHGINLEKIASDLRILASDLSGSLAKLPKKQMGSSMMPGKVNPVIPEFVIQIASQVQSNDLLIARLSAGGCLDLNPYLPLIGHRILESVDLCIHANQSLRLHAINGFEIVPDQDAILTNPSTTTLLVPRIGHEKAQILAKFMNESGQNLITAMKQYQFLDEETTREILNPARMSQLGFTVKE